jgi:hypothetical protein
MYFVKLKENIKIEKRFKQSSLVRFSFPLFAAPWDAATRVRSMDGTTWVSHLGICHDGTTTKFRRFPKEREMCMI